ncbi:YbaB/EbfC family nucleoid-associated protein [Lachnospiraceae bacterium oral taxon 500]|nr:YbaB/EbfC family nucleoid-associated protein [Lachnospiraceae bacterium oral taxon 500]
MAKRGGFPGAMPGNQANLMKQVQRMQKQMETMQEEIENKEFEAAVGGGAVKATVNGKKELKAIELSPSAVDPEDIEMLQDLIVAAVNEAVRKAETEMNEEMSKLTGGLNLPGGLGGLF